MNLRRLCYAASLVASVLSVIATVDGWDRPLLWLASAVGFIALAGTVAD